MGNPRTIESTKTARKIDYNVLLIVLAHIFGHYVRALVDSGAAKGFIFVDSIKPLGLYITKEHTFLKLGYGEKILFRGKVLDVPMVTVGLVFKMDFTVRSLLHDVDLILGINWIQLANPFTD